MLQSMLNNDRQAIFELSLIYYDEKPKEQLRKNLKVCYSHVY